MEGSKTLNVFLTFGPNYKKGDIVSILPSIGNEQLPAGVTFRSAEFSSYSDFVQKLSAQNLKFEKAFLTTDCNLFYDLGSFSIGGKEYSAIEHYVKDHSTNMDQSFREIDDILFETGNPENTLLLKNYLIPADASTVTLCFHFKAK